MHRKTRFKVVGRLKMSVSMDKSHITVSKANVAVILNATRGNSCCVLRMIIIEIFCTTWKEENESSDEKSKPSKIIIGKAK